MLISTKVLANLLVVPAQPVKTFNFKPQMQTLNPKP
jgi:hypothetical protein